MFTVQSIFDFFYHCRVDLPHEQVDADGLELVLPGVGDLEPHALSLPQEWRVLLDELEPVLIGVCDLDVLVTPQAAADGHPKLFWVLETQSHMPWTPED